MGTLWVVELTRAALWLAFLLGGPFMLVALVLGLSISVIQAATQVNEMTLSFVPKLLGLGLCMWLAVDWMVQQWTRFLEEIMNLVASGAFP